MKIVKKEYQVFEYHELSGDSKQRVLENLHDINTDYDWWENDYCDFKDTLIDIGIRCDNFYFSLEQDFYISMSDPCVIDPKLFLRYCAIDLRTVDAREIMDMGIGIETNCFEMGRTGNSIEQYYRLGITQKTENKLNEGLSKILDAFLYLLKQEYEVRTGKEEIIDTIEVNEYRFLEDGTLFKG